MNLIFINGTMGAGKTTAARALQKLLPPCAAADGDDFWNMFPFTVNDISKEMVLSNTAAVLSGFIRSGLFENIVFSWVMHEESVVNEILSRLPGGERRFYLFTLVFREETLKKRLSADVAAGKRSGGIFARSAERAAHYAQMLSYKIAADGLTPGQTADIIARTVRGQTGLLPYKKTAHLTAEGRAIREEVFVKEQGFADEFDARDGNCSHLVFYKDGEPAACCRCFGTQEKGIYAVGRIAVRKKFRGQNIGSYAVQAAEECARAEGASGMTLSAQVRARGFYEKCGYTAEGEIYSEEGVPHVTMRKMFGAQERAVRNE